MYKSLVSGIYRNKSEGFVYAIGLHAVQFGNNWMKKILRTAKIEQGQFGCQEYYKTYNKLAFLSERKGTLSCRNSKIPLNFFPRNLENMTFQPGQCPQYHYLPINVDREQCQVSLSSTQGRTSPCLFYSGVKTKSRARHSRLSLKKRLVFCSAVKCLHCSACIINTVHIHGVRDVKIIIA